MILEKQFFFNQEKTGVNKCFEPLALSIFTTAASRLKSEQKEEEK